MFMVVLCHVMHRASVRVYRVRVFSIALICVMFGKSNKSANDTQPIADGPTTPTTSRLPGRPGNLSPGQQHQLDKFRTLVSRATN